MFEPTPNQRKIIDEIKTLINTLPIIIIKGDDLSGKHFTVSTFFKENGIVPSVFDLCKVGRNLSHKLTSQDIISYLDELTNSGNEYHYIYIRRLDRILRFLSDYQHEQRYFTTIILKDWFQSLGDNIRIIITTEDQINIGYPYMWTIAITNNKEDLSFILKKEGIKSEFLTEISKIGNQNFGQIYHCIKYAKARKIDFVKDYLEAHSKLTGSNVNAEGEVIKPTEDLNLIGLDEVIENIKTYILKPIEINHPDIPIKRGIVLCGPPGTGKTSIGRWLAHQLKGKFYLISGEEGICGKTLISTIENKIELASKNAPGVIFIDDVDVLFGNDDTYRAFLTLLDGLTDKKRENVCVIVTVMNIRKIPASLIRGGRLELCLNVDLPTNETIMKILESGFIKIYKILDELKIKYSGNNNPCIIPSLATKMSGWNCADVNRCINDVLRIIIYNHKEVTYLDIIKIFENCISQIREQYEKCGPIELFVNSDKISYIS